MPGRAAVRRSFKRKAVKRFKKNANKKRRLDKENKAIDFYVAQRQAEEAAQISSSEDETQNVVSPSPWQKLLKTVQKHTPAALVPADDPEDEIDIEDEEAEEEEEEGLPTGDDVEYEYDDEELPDGAQALAAADDDDDEEEEEEEGEDMVDAYAEAPTIEPLVPTTSAPSYDTQWYTKYHQTHTEGCTTETYQQKCDEHNANLKPRQSPAYFPNTQIVASTPVPEKANAAFEFLKQGPSKLYDNWQEFLEGKTPTTLQRGLFATLSRYIDVMYCGRTWDNDKEIMATVVLHMWKHISNAKFLCSYNQHQIKNKSKSKRKAQQKKSAKAGKKQKKAQEQLDEESDDEADADAYRDSGFSNCRCLLILPYRSLALQYVEMFMQVHRPTDPVGNLQRFEADFSELESEIDPNFSKRPPEYQRQFEGNISDDFCVGVRFTQKGMKLYDHYFYADLLIASPLRIAKELKKKENGHDFLSSVEVLIIDQASTILMQNWTWMTHVMSKVSLPVTRVRKTTDYQRLYSWLQDGCGRYFRQTVMISSYMDSMMNALFRTFTNPAGKMLIIPQYPKGSIGQVYVPARCVFQRVECDSIEDSADARFEYFKTEVMSKIQSALTSLYRKEHFLIVIPSYFDYVKLRNYYEDMDRFCFCELCEYTSPKESKLAIKEFTAGDRNVMLFTERYFFFKRYLIRSAKTILFYQPPNNAEFFSTIVNGLNTRTGDNAAPVVTTLFTKFDNFQLQRILGTQNTKKILTAEKSTHLFQ